MRDIKRQNSRITIIAALISLLLALGLTWPVCLSPTELLIGHPGNDTWNHVWGYWWVGESLSRGEWPSNAAGLSWPDGGTLYFIDTVQAIASWPIQLAFGPAFAYNSVVIFQLALCGFAAWLLAWKITGDKLAAFIALIIFESSPHLLGQTYNGISETVCAGWIPLTLWTLIRLMERPTWKNASYLGLTGGVCILSSWYYGLFVIMGSLIILLWNLIRQAWLFEWKKIGTRLPFSILISILMVIGPFMAFRGSLNAADALVKRDPKFVEASLLNHNITDVYAFFNPTKTPSPDLFTLYGEELIIVIYLGWIAIGLSLFAAWSVRRSKDLRPWIWFAMVFFLFALGPYLNAGGKYVEFSYRKIPLPFLPLYKSLPIFDRISHPFRFVIGVQLALSIMASLGFRLIYRKFNRPIALLGVLGTLILLEVRFFSPAAIPVPASNAATPAAYVDLADKEGAILDLPLTPPNLERAVYVWHQHVHKRPVPWGLNDPMPKHLLDNQLTSTLLQIEGSRAMGLPPMVPELDLVVSSRSLIRAGYTHLVVHEYLYPPSKRKQAVDLLTALYGEPTAYPEDRILVFSMEL